MLLKKPLESNNYWIAEVCVKLYRPMRLDNFYTNDFSAA